jgi:hypothetical protein
MKRVAWGYSCSVIVQPEILYSQWLMPVVAFCTKTN